jgi:hypothetical protein
LLRQVAQSPPEFIEIAALGALLHAFYTGVENIFKRIALEIDDQLPIGPYWHSDLLNLMAQAAVARPAVITPPLRQRLKEYLNFRHVFRQAYTFDLDWAKMAALVLDCEDTWRQLHLELEQFFKPISP